MTQTVTVTQASIADLIEQRDGLLEALRRFIDDIDGAHTTMVEFDANVERARAAIAKASPIAGLTEIGGEEVKNSTASQSKPVLTPKSAIGNAENGGPRYTPGPWKCDRNPVFGQWFVRQDPVNWNGMGYQLICSIPADKKGSHYGDMFAANALLIAAAPVLLVNARKNLATMEETRRRLLRAGMSHHELDMAIEQTCAAISHAEDCAPTSRSAPDDGALAPITPGDSGRTQP